MRQKARLRRRDRTARNAGRSGQRKVDLLDTARHLNRHLTEELCEEVFTSTRVTERQRVWSLHTLAEFWTRVVLKAPGSLTQALEEALRGEGTVWPQISGTPQAFFERTRTLNWTFFAELYHRFVASITQSVKPAFATEFANLRQHFPEVWIVDGSRLDAVAHRLKILWDVRSPVLPGCLLAFFDLFRGYPRVLQFDPDAARAEMHRVREALEQVPDGTLLLGDRLYASIQLFEDLTQRRIWGLCRRNSHVSIRPLELLSCRRLDGGILEDWLVEAGSGQTAPRQRLRHIRFKRGTTVYELLTNVLDPRKLSAAIAMRLYPRRWNVERMFFDLKEVLNLHQFYAANPNAVAMQVFAAAMVYTAMRVAQASAARQVDVEPEEISPAKFFPRVANACATLAGIELGYWLTCQENPGRKLRPPDPRGRPELTTTFAQIAVQRRKGVRRKRRFCPSRRRWKSFAHVPGGKSLITNRSIK